MKRINMIVCLWLWALGMVNAQLMDPVKFKSALTTDDKGGGEIVFSGTIQSGWHVYSVNLGSGGPIEASFHAEKLQGVELVGKLRAEGKEISQFDPMFNATLRYFENSVRFVQKVRFTAKHYDIDCYLEYGACSDKVCMPPEEVPFRQRGENMKTAPKKETAKEKQAQEEVTIETQKEAQGELSQGEMQKEAQAPGASTSLEEDAQLSNEPVAKEQETGSDAMSLSGDTALQAAEHSMLYILLAGFLGGLLALFTPCVWPIIPMTVSFFLKRADNRRRAIRDAMAYGLSIIVIYLTLGLLVTALFGPSYLNALSTNAVFNIFLFLLLVVFALSFFGWFELRLPASWGNKIDSKASETSGLLSIFLMAFTLALVSFSCTAPIVGFLLVESVTTGDITGPAIGMLGFALALALPFTLFALFPTWLKQAPKSGAWMNIIKVTLGFIELAFSLKFFSVADLAHGWHLLDREVFLSLWIAIFFLLGLYLVGLLKFPGDMEPAGMPAERKAMPVPCIMLGLLSLAFTVYMVPGLWGAPCKAISAFTPHISTQDFNLNTQTVEARYTDFDEALAAARREGKPVLIDFTGYGCVNCRKMEAAVWTDPTVARLLTEDYVLVSLYVDDKKPLPEPIKVVENGVERTLRTVGDRWSYLQRTRFKANTQPFYIAVDANGQPLSGSYSYNEDVAAYVRFLQQPLKKK